MEEPPNGRPGRSRSPYSYLGLGFELAVPFVLFMYAGYRLDGRLGTAPWLLVVGALLGMAVGFYGLFRRLGPSNKGENGRKG